MRAPDRNRTHLPGPRPARAVAHTATAVVLLLTLPHLAAPPHLTAQDADLERGAELYDRWCAACHGFEGDGQGPAAEYMLPRPRDFTGGIYQIRTTRGGELPTDDDILRMIDEGMPGTTMPGWEGFLSRADREALVEYLKSFYPPFETMGEPEAVDFGRAPRATDEALEQGRILFDSIECYQCHGGMGRGDGGSVPDLEDDWGNPIRPADLHMNWRFNGGGSVEEIYRRLYTGMDGTPMPAHSDLVDAGIITEDDLWSVAHYVRSLSPDRPPRIREVIRVDRTEPGELPSSVDDERWEEAEAFYIPLVAQIIVMPRWFDPSVKAVWVEGLHDGEELALRLTWHDPSQSPDPAWMEWQERILEAMEPKEGDELEAGPRPDRFALQFPRSIPDEARFPYFLMGDDRDPVHLWRWRSDEAGIENAIAMGMTEITPLDGTEVQADAQWEDGRWRLVLRRSLEADNPDEEIEFEEGVSIPVAFYAWDGDHGEEGTRGAVTSWYFLHLMEETPVTVYVAPVAAALLTAGLGILAVLRAQRREERAEAPVPEDRPVAPGDGHGEPQPETGG